MSEGQQANEPLWPPERVCTYLGGISRRHFLERVACKPDFPKPFVLSRKSKMWYPAEVREWVRRNRPKG
jgi:predicted DNA-binding transcriptional regulator AlpA